MNYIVGKNNQLNINGKHMEIERGLQCFYEEKAEKLIFNLPQSYETTMQFKTFGKKNKKTFSHIAIIKLKDKLYAISDGYINSNPDIKTLSSIVSNSIFVFDKISTEKAKVAVLSAVELVSLAMESAIPASVMEAMGKRGQFGKDVFVEGPLSIDVAISEKSAKEKKVNTEVAGNANILIGHKSTIPNGIISALKLFAKPDFFISVVTDGKFVFPFILDIMNETDIDNTIEFCS